ESIVPNLPKQLISVVHRSLQKDPTKRIAKAEEFSRELQWIRKALQASGELAPMEETKFASTQVLKALHEDLQKQPTGTSSPKTAGAPRTAVSERVPSIPEDNSSKKWIALAAVSALVIVGVGGWAFFGSGSSSEKPQTSASASAPASSTPPPPASGAPASGQP